MFKKIMASAAVATALIAGSVVSAPASFAATKATCGFNAEPAAFYFTNCSSKTAKVKVHYLIGSSTKCIRSGKHIITYRGSNPLTNPTNATVVGTC